MVPPAHGTWLTERIPGVRAHLYPDHGHLSLSLASFGAIIADLADLAALGTR
jgi:hypothetical protein